MQPAANSAELWFRDVLVATVTDLSYHQDTYFGTPHFAVRSDEDDELRRRLRHFVAFSLEWNRRVEDAGTEVSELDAFADVLTGDGWSCRYAGTTRPIEGAPSFFDPNECSWRCTTA